MDDRTETNLGEVHEPLAPVLKTRLRRATRFTEVGRQMQRDMDLVREILLKVEALSLPPGAHQPMRVWELEIEGYDGQTIFDNWRLAVNGGLIDTVGKFSQDGRVGVRGLSWEGAEFLDKVRKPENWVATKSIASKVGSFSYDVLKAAASAVITDQMKKVGS